MIIIRKNADFMRLMKTSEFQRAIRTREEGAVKMRREVTGKVGGGDTSGRETFLIFNEDANVYSHLFDLMV
ncbi:hypothetical protein B1694_18355 [Geobacillus zalihae]|nr:hypothetical protein B1694_18355 [Geobacillus zalihae]